MAVLQVDSIDTTALLATSVVLLLGYSLWVTRRPSRFPPGPPLVPILGTIPFMKTPLHKTSADLAKKYGDIFSLYIGGSFRIVMLNSYTLIRKALVDNAVAFASRPSYPYRMQHYNPHQIGIGDGRYSPEWKKQRGLVMSLMRSIGYGKHSTEEKIQQEAAHLVTSLKKTGGKAFNPEDLIKITVTNIISYFLFDERFDHDDEEFAKFMKVISEYLLLITKDLEGDVIPPLRMLPSHRQTIKVFIESCHHLEAFLTEKISKRQNKLDAQKEKGEVKQPTDFITAYLEEVEKAKNGNGSGKLSENWVLNIALDFFIAGSDTTSSTLMWGLLYMATHPHVQERVHKELDEVLSEEQTQNEHMSLSMRSKLPYVEATILEIQRLASIAVLSLPHCTTQDVEFEGYFLPKDTEVWVNLYQVSRDPELWENPEEFRPERFIDENGEVHKPEYWTPFSLGRRSCLGEQLAKQELFLFFTTMMRHFRFTAPPGVQLTLEATDSDIVRQPLPYELCAVPR